MSNEKDDGFKWPDGKLGVNLLSSSYLESEYLSEEPVFQFMGHGEEILRIMPDGKVFFQGREIGEDKEIFEALQYWASKTLSSG